MNAEQWLYHNGEKLGSSFEELFVRGVLPLLEGFDYSTLTAQMEFYDIDNRKRFCDFVVTEGKKVRVAIEIDGYDKRGNGTGMSHEDFVDWQRRHAALVSQGWDVIRFANRDVRDHPKRCAYYLSLVIKKARQDELSEGERAQLASFEGLEKKSIKLNRDNKALKTTVWALVFLLATGFSVFMLKDQLAPMDDVIAGNGNLGSPNLAAGESCSDPVTWQSAKDHIGETVAISGKVENITRREDVNGQPTWIDLGSTYPNKSRVNLVIWGSDADKFTGFLSSGIIGNEICAHGEIAEYKGVPQITLRDVWQLSDAK